LVFFCGYEDEVIIRRDSRESLKPGAGRIEDKNKGSKGGDAKGSESEKESGSAGS